MRDRLESGPSPLADEIPKVRDLTVLLRGSIYSGLIPPPHTGEPYPVRQVMEFALDLAEVLLVNGANARETEVAVVAVTTTWHLAPLEMEVTAAAVRLQYLPKGAEPVTEMRVIRSSASNLTVVDRLYKLVERITRGDFTLVNARRELRRIEHAGPRWPWPLRLFATGFLGFLLSFLAGGSLLSATWAFLLVTVVTSVAHTWEKWSPPPFFLTALQAALGMTWGTVVLSLGWLNAGETATMVAPLIVLLLPHPQIVACAQDAITGFREPANARVLSIVMIVMAVLLGMPAGLVVTQSWFHVQVNPSAIRLVPLSAFTAIGVSMAAAGANAIGQSVSVRMVPIAVVAAGGASAFQGMFLAAGFTSLFATFLAAVFLGMLSTILAYPLKTSATVLEVPAFCGALLPSLAVAESLLNVVGQSPNSGLQLATALLSTLSIGAGLVLGGYFVTPVVRRAASRRVPLGMG